MSYPSLSVMRVIIIFTILNWMVFEDIRDLIHIFQDNADSVFRVYKAAWIPPCLC